MDKLSNNNIPSVSNDEGLDSGDGETESDELYQLSTISCTFIPYCMVRTIVHIHVLP